MNEFQVTTERRTQVIDVTQRVLGALGEPADATAVLVYVPHATAGVIIQEPRGDNTVAQDLEMAFERIVDDDWPYTHFEPHERNPWSHVRAALAGSSVVIPLQDGRPAFGTWQGVFLCEFDGPRTRKVYVSALR